jgi:hypothetical protein
MLHDFVIDPFRLLLRKAWKRWGCRLLVFMAMPTRRELRALFRGCLPGGKPTGGVLGTTASIDIRGGEFDTPRGEFVVQKDRNTLH